MRLKFGKVGLLFLALVISLAGIGGAFAAWTTEVTFEGQVNTGYLTFEIDKYSGTEAWKVNDHEIEVLKGWLPLGSPTGTPVLADPVGKAFAREGGENEADVVFEYDNLFPCVEWCADFLLHYTGSVPVIVTAEIGTEAPWLQWLWDNGYVEVKVYESDADGGPGPAIDLFDGFWQMHFCDYVVVEVCIKIPQTHPEGEFNNFQGQTGSFSGRIHAIQWNKYENGNGNDIDWAITTAMIYVPAEGKETAWALGTHLDSWVPNWGWGGYFQYTVGESVTLPFVAGQVFNIGTVSVSDNGTHLEVVYQITDTNWEIKKTDLHVGTAKPFQGICTWLWKSEGANKIPPDPKTPYNHTYVIPLNHQNIGWAQTFYIAAHAEVLTTVEQEFAVAFDIPDKTAVLELLCTGFAYNWLVEFTVKNTGEQDIKITNATVTPTGSVTAVFDPAPPPIIDQVLAVGEETTVSVRVNVPACDDVGDPAGTVTLEVFAKAA